MGGMDAADTPGEATAAGLPAPPARVRGARVAHALLWLALGLTCAGLAMPAITISSFWVYEETYSILGGILAMFERGDVILGAFVLCMSALFPVGKILAGLAVLRRLREPKPRVARLLGILSQLSRWSMADVLVLALVVVVLNGQLLTAADLHSGVALFALGVAASALGLALVERRAGGR